MSHFSAAAVTLRRASENCRGIRPECLSALWRAESTRVESYPEIRVWLGPAGDGDLRGVARTAGNALFRGHGNAVGPEIDVGSLK